MLYTKNNSQKLDKNLFQNPTAEYRAVPFWSWNCKVTKELIDNQLLIFKEMGFGGVDIHPRAGMETEYLSREYMELVEYTVLRCKELGLTCWLYDEDRFPSGAAGGIVTKNFRFRGRFLLLTETRKTLAEGFYEDREAFENAIDMGIKPAGYYVTAYALNFEKGYLKSYRRLLTEAAVEAALQNGEKVRFAYVKLMEEEAWFEEQAYVDTMNPEAIAEFIRVTHEAYYGYVGKEFGEVVLAIFTDEPRMGKHAQLNSAMSGDDVTMPYTDYLAETMQQKYGIDPLDIVPEYIWDLAEEEFSVNRYYYRDLCAECFVTAFMDQICEWCEEHNIVMTGHVLAEETLASQAFALGDCMRCYRNMDVPGIDILVDRKEFSTAKQAASVARQNGKEGVTSELYGVTHWDCDFKTFKLQGDWQAALGITFRVPHLSHMSLQGEAKRDWPGSIFFHAPWYKEYPYIEDHFARLNTVMTRGRALVNIGVLHPIESVWMYMGPEEQTIDIRREMDEDFSNMINWLLYGTMDFDFLSEALLPKQCEEFLEEPSKLLQVGRMNYQAVIVPNMVTIRGTTLDILETFHKMGGRIIFMGRIPELVDGRKSDRAYNLANKCICIGKDRNELYAALEENRIVDIRKGNGFRSDNLFYQMRQDNDCRWLFVCHVEHKKHHISVLEKYQIRVKGRYAVTLYDTQTGETVPVQSQYDGEDTLIECSMYAEDSVLYQLQELLCECDRGSVVGKNAVSYETVQRLTEVETYSRQEKNALLLDYAEYQVDAGEKQPREEILRLDNKIREQLGFVIRKERMSQPYHLEEKETHMVTLYYHFASKIETPAFLAIEEPAICQVWLNSEEADRTVLEYYVDSSIAVIALPDVREGENELVVQVRYHQKTNLENLFVLGDFDVELNGNNPVIVQKRSNISIGDITGQGMPFYTGNLNYTFGFEVEDEESEYYVHIPHFKAPVLRVAVDGNDKGLIAYAPHRQMLGKLKKGYHELTLCVFGNRFNGFGTLHNANEDFSWYGPDSFRTTGDDWTDCYALRPVGILGAVEIQK